MLGRYTPATLEEYKQRFGSKTDYAELGSAHLHLAPCNRLGEAFGPRFGRQEPADEEGHPGEGEAIQP